MARLIRVDGTETIVTPKGKKWTLEELQMLVGGYIEFVPSIQPVRMLVDEEGLLKMKPLNAKATDIVCQKLAGKQVFGNPVIVGDVLILDKGEKM